LTKVEELPGVGITGGVVGITGSGAGVGGVDTGGVRVSTVATGAVGEPPPHWLNTAALPSRRAIPSAGRKRADILVVRVLPGWGLTSDTTL
jgi:hypothetical protein